MMLKWIFWKPLAWALRVACMATWTCEEKLFDLSAKATKKATEGELPF